MRQQILCVASSLSRIFTPANSPWQGDVTYGMGFSFEVPLKSEHILQAMPSLHPGFCRRLFPQMSAFHLLAHQRFPLNLMAGITLGNLPTLHGHWLPTMLL